MQYNNFGKFLRAKREAMTPRVALNKFALETEIDSATISRIERNLQGVTLKQIGKFAEFYNLPASKLIEEFETYLLTHCPIEG